MSPKKYDSGSARPPAELRAIFGQNLRKLCQAHPSISSVCRDLDTNRTQFNRYLSGDSFPRPDVLQKLCTYFNTDARILLEPLEHIESTSTNPLMHSEMYGFFGQHEVEITSDIFPIGFFRFSRRSFLADNLFVQGLIYVYKKDNKMFLRGMEAKEAIEGQGLNADAKTREFRGIIIAQEGGLVMLAFRRGASSCSFSYLSPTTSFENNFWLGYSTRTVPEHLVGTRIARLVFEHLGEKRAEIMATARQAGLCDIDQLWPYHGTLLRPHEPFS